jgi:hypothetical protein
LAIAGRYAVRFASEWSQSVDLARSDIQIELVELA